MSSAGPATPTSPRALLRAEASSVDRARGDTCRDEGSALALWSALCAGQWTFVDRFDAGGRRVLIARRNPPALVAPRALNLRERQVVTFAALGGSNKSIAHALALSTSTVASHLAHALRKLGLSSRVALVELASRLVAEVPS
ncbi:LuxR C-terminal-related transcriptional regulator [Myxococcota bacterium]|nr:LuxR C-terminal-related transcriptional regulator [Myxococcota bacterium]